MNRRKVLAVVGALILAAVGTALLVAYVNDAEDRALEGEERVEVLVVSRTIAAGTEVADIGGSVNVELVPQKVRADNAVTTLGDIEGLVAVIELVPGEQLVRSRFVDPVAFEREIGRVTDIPAGMQEVTISLAPERAGGGALLPGDTVAVYASFEPFQVSSEVPVEIDNGIVIPPNGSTPNSTQVLLHKVLVTNVQLEELPEVDEREGLGDEEDREVRLAPSGNLLVSLAVDTFDGERLVFTSEFGFIWLSIQPETAVEEPSVVQTRGTVYQALENLIELIETGADEQEDSGE